MKISLSTNGGDKENLNKVDNKNINVKARVHDGNLSNVYHISSLDKFMHLPQSSLAVQSETMKIRIINMNHVYY